MSSTHAPPAASKPQPRPKARDSGYADDVPPDEPVVWEVMWREPQARKNKSWDSDGILILKGGNLTLRNEDGRIIGSGAHAASTQLETDSELKVGGKDVQIADRMPYAAYLAKYPSAPTAFPSQATASIQPRPSNTTAKTRVPPAVALPLPPTRRFKPLIPAPSRTANPFAAKSAAPPAIPVNTSNAVAGPSESRVQAHERERAVERAEGASGPKAREAWQKEWEREQAQSSSQPRPPSPGKENAASSQPVPLRVEPPLFELFAPEDDDSDAEMREVDEIEPPRASQRRGLGDVPVDLSLEDRKPSVKRKVEQIEIGDEDEDDEVIVVEPPPVPSKLKLDKGKGKEVEPPRKKVTLVPRKAVDEAPVASRYYLCQWRNYTTKKHPVWEGDGVLIIAGRKATLKDRDTGKDIGSGNSTGARFNPGDEVSVGSKTVEVESDLDEKDFLDGKVFLKAPLRPSPRAPVPAVNAVAAGSFFSSHSRNIAPSTGLVKDLWHNPRGGKPKVVEAKFDPKGEGAIVMRRPDAQHEAAYNKKNFPIVDVVVDPILSSRLRDHQVEGVKFMYECVMGMKSEGQGCILADEMGLGKTIQAITLIYTLLHQDPYHKGASSGVIQRAMIACPVTLVKNWDAEIKKWLGKDRLKTFVVNGKNDVKRFASTKHYQVLIIGYEKLRTVIDVVKACQPPIGLIICDEGHRLKSASSQLTVALKKLSTPRRVILSGTPMQNDLGEFHSMVDFINPGVLDSYSTFKKVFETVILKSRQPKASAQARQLGEARMEQLSRVSRSYIIRRTGEVIQKFLPPKLEYTVFIVPTELELKLYAAILEGSAVKDLLSGRGSQQLSLLMILRQLSNTPGLLMNSAKEGKSTDVLTDNITTLFPSDADPNDFNLSGKLLAVGSLLEKLFAGGNEKIVVVSNFTSTLDIIEKHCQRKKYPTCRLDGKTPQVDRIPIVEGFNKGQRKTNFVFLLSSKSGGTGLNIIGASRLVMIDSDWNPSSDLQAMARIHRQGQTKQCVIYRFLSAGTMDEKIFQRQVTKLGLSGSLMDAADSVGGAVDKGDAFTLDELKNVFKLHTGVSCQTHDLLGCRCHLEDGLAANDSADEDSDEELPTADELLSSFVPASQYHQDELDLSTSKDRKNLSVLKSWIHHNCRDEDAAAEIEDSVLREVVFLRVADAPKEVGIQAEGGSALRGGHISFAFAKKTG